MRVIDIPRWDSRGNAQRYVEQPDGTWIDCYNEVYRSAEFVFGRCEHEWVEDGSDIKTCRNCLRRESVYCNHVIETNIVYIPHSWDSPEEEWSVKSCKQCGMSERDIRVESELKKVRVHG